MEIIKKVSASMGNEVVQIKIRPVELRGQESSQSEQRSPISNKDRQQVLKEARQAAEDIKAQAQEQGRKEGYSQGYHEGLDQVKQSLKQLKRIKGELAGYKQQILKQAEPEIVKLAQYIAEKVIRQKINEQDAIVVSCLNFALKQVGGLDNLVIRLNPKDYRYLIANKQEIEDMISKFEDIKLVDDQRIEKGGCLIETEKGNIDAQASSQLKILDRMIREEFYSQGAE